MFSIAFNRPLATLAVVSGLLVAAAPASAKMESPRDVLSGVQRTASDGTSNTVIFAESRRDFPEAPHACDAAAKDAGFLLSSPGATPSP